MSLNILPVGHILKNEFKIISSLGQGGFGITYLAEDMELGGKVVIKEFLPQSMAARDQSHHTVVPHTSEDKLFDHLLKRFREEAQLLNKLRHPNIVTVTRLFRENHTAYFVMDFEEGETLADYLKLHPTFSEEAILSIMMPIFEGTKYVHENGVLHRDIAPDNIYLKQNGMPILIDFGAARNAIAQKSQTISAIAKEGYSPPEQYTSNSEQTAATDIYALGAVMYRMVTGHKPANSAHRLMAIQNEEPDPVGDLVANYQDRYSTPLLQAITKALDTRQKYRFGSIGEFQEAIAGKVIPELESAPIISDPTPDPAPIKNRLLLLVGVVALVVLAGFGVKYVDGTEQRDSVTVEPTVQEEPVPQLKQIAEVQKPKENSKEKEVKEVKKVKEDLGEAIDRGSYIKPAMVPISKGSFMMGSDNGDNDEKPVHSVTIDYNFAIGKYEVSVGEFRKFVEDTGYQTGAEKSDGCYVYDDGWKKKSDANWKNPYFRQSDKHPVVCLSWNDTKAYTKWLTKKTGKNYRLPTEAEWEFVARAATQSRWSFGERESGVCQYGNIGDVSYNKHFPNDLVVTKECDDGHIHTAPRGSLSANPWGLYDIHGNVWEWCEDWYQDSYSSIPMDGRANQSKNKNYRVLRGGSWDFSAHDIRSASRSRIYPSARYSNLGFRIQSTLP